MKYALLIPLGAADEPQDALDGRTPLEAAALPNTSAIAAAGRVGAADHALGDPWTGAGLAALLAPESADVTDASLLAFGAGLDLPPDAWAYSLGWMATQSPSGQPSAGDESLIAEWDESTITPAESDALWSDIAAAWRSAEPELARTADLHRVHEGAWVLIDRGPRDRPAAVTHAPWAVIGEPWRKVEPGGPEQAAWPLRRLLHIGSSVLATHDVNAFRAERGLPLITMPWPFGPGRPPVWPAFGSRFPVRGVMVTDDAVAAAAARAVGWTIVRADGEDALGAAAVDALGAADLVCVAAAGPRRASLLDDPHAKVRALEAFDRGVVGPVAARLRDFGDPETDAEARGWRLLLMPDCVWPTGAYEPADEQTPALLAGAWIRSVVRRDLSESAGAESDLRIADPAGLIEFFLLGGLAKARAVGRKKEDSGTLWEIDP